MKKLVQPSIVKTSPPVPAQGLVHPGAQPELFWLGTPHPNSCLWPVKPDIAEKPLDEFLDNMADAAGRIWILDSHFDGQCGFAAIQSALDLSLEAAKRDQRSLSVRILTGTLKELEEWLKEKKLSYPEVERRAGGAGVHDRYALIDSELWHFGSTVGGGHPDLSCATRGWPSHHATQFAQLFSAWWEK